MRNKSMRISKEGLTLKDIDMGKRTAVIAQATYGSADRDKDIANKGMFTKSWNENRNDIRLFKNHDPKTGPGRVDDFWEDNKHGYVKAYLGTHTEGDDVLKQLDENIIVAASYGFIDIPSRQVKIKGGGYDIKEVRWMETSLLTHWGSHQESGVVSVTKMLHDLHTKDLNDSEKAFLRKLIANRTEGLMLAIDMNSTVIEGTDMWSYINDLIADQSYSIAWLKRRLEYGVKELNDIKLGIKAMEKFVYNTKASDECIQRIQIELDNTKQLLSDLESVTSAPDQSTQTPTSTKDNEFLRHLNYSLLKVNTL